MYADFDTSKIRPGEPVAILGNDPSVPSGKALYIAFAANDVRRLCSIEDISEMVNAGEFVGPQGPRGEKGDKGDPGEKGADGTVAFESLTPEQKESLRGISIKSASVDTDGNLTITFSDGDSEDVGNIMGPQGIQGSKGDKGVGIKKITDYYALSSSNTDKAFGQVWLTTPPTMTAEKKYLWHWQRTDYTDDSFYSTEKGVIGVYGEQGLKGDKGDKGPKGDNMSDEQAAQIEQNKTDIASLKEDLANLENTLELPKDIYVLEPSDIQSGYIIDSNGTIRTNKNCTLYKYDVTNINSVYISHRGAASMPVYWLGKNVLISHFTAEYDTWSGKVDTSNADTLYLNMISIYTPVVSCLVEGKRVPGYGKSYVDLQGKSSGHFYLINSESGCFFQQETTDSQYATYYPIFLKAGKYRFNSAVSTTFSIIVKNDEISHLNFTENKLNIVEFDTDVTLYPTSTRGRDAVICDASIDILSVSDKGLFPICNPIYVGNKMDFSTIKEATTYISDSSKEKEYNIYIEKGTYNESSITLPDYVNLIGLSNEKESVWVKGELPDNALDTEITPNSTINISMNNKFKNITVSAKNLRYSVHDESNNKQKNWNQRFDNCKFIHYGTYGAKSYREEHSLDTSNLWTSCHAWGEGASDGSFIEFNDCIFESVENGYYVHEGISQSEPYKRIFNNCEFIMIDTVNINQKWNSSISIDNTRDITAKNILLFNNCFISDSMRINGTIPIDVRLSGCGIVPIRANMNTDMYPLNTECMDDCYYVGDTPLVGGEVLAITNRHNQVVIANENTQKELICGVAVGTVNKYGYVRVMKKGYISLAGKYGILYTVGENGQIANATNESKLIIGVCVGQFVKLLID
nr:MAG: chondroitinase B [Bacteriophage sp.]